MILAKQQAVAWLVLRQLEDGPRTVDGLARHVTAAWPQAGGEVRGVLHTLQRAKCVFRTIGGQGPGQWWAIAPRGRALARRARREALA